MLCIFACKVCKKPFSEAASVFPPSEAISLEKLVSSTLPVEGTPEAAVDAAVDAATDEATAVAPVASGAAVALVVVLEAAAVELVPAVSC